MQPVGVSWESWAEQSASSGEASNTRTNIIRSVTDAHDIKRKQPGKLRESTHSQLSFLSVAELPITGLAATLAFLLQMLSYGINSSSFCGSCCLTIFKSIVFYSWAVLLLFPTTELWGLLFFESQNYGGQPVQPRLGGHFETSVLGSEIVELLSEFQQHMTIYQLCTLCLPLSLMNISARIFLKRIYPNSVAYKKELCIMSKCDYSQECKVDLTCKCQYNVQRRSIDSK